MVKKLPKCKCCGERFMPLNNDALQKYCTHTDQCIKAHLEWCKSEVAKKKLKNIESKEWRIKKAEMKITTHSKEFKFHLQKNINMLSRMIDAYFGYDTCIDCGRPFGNQTDAAHFHGTGSNSSLRFNLHNLHSARSECNQFSDSHKSGYELGLVKRYGITYTDMVRHELQIKYPLVKLISKEIHEKLQLVRLLIKNFDSYLLQDATQARTLFNNLIGIYQ